jgi:hypothetical protein
MSTNNVSKDLRTLEQLVEEKIAAEKRSLKLARLVRARKWEPWPGYVISHSLVFAMAFTCFFVPTVSLIFWAATCAGFMILLLRSVHWRIFWRDAPSQILDTNELVIALHQQIEVATIEKEAGRDL